MMKPHGGILVNRIAVGEAREELLRKAAEFPELVLNRQQLGELENIATGLYVPLEGFLDELNYYSVSNEMRLRDGNKSGPCQLYLNVSEEEARSLSGRYSGKPGKGRWEDIRYSGPGGYKVCARSDQWRAEQVYQTIDDRHPGVANLFIIEEGFLLGGKVTY